MGFWGCNQFWDKKQATKQYTRPEKNNEKKKAAREGGG